MQFYWFFHLRRRRRRKVVVRKGRENYLGLLNLAYEADKTGDAPSYSGKFGFRF